MTSTQPAEKAFEPVSLYLMNQKGWSVLSALLDHFGPDAIAHVVTSRDAAMAKDYYTEITELCMQHHVPVYDRSAKDLPAARYKIAIGWRWIIADEKNLIVLHDSLLPKYRGFAPLVNALVNGEPEIGVTALFASSEYDKGEIIGQLATSVSYPITIGMAIDLVSSLYEDLVVGIVGKLGSGKNIHSVPQDETKATYSLWREEEDYCINWNQSATAIRRFIDAVGFPFKGASAVADGKQIRIIQAEELDDVKIENRDPGKIIFMNEGQPVVVCGNGLIKITGMTNETGMSLLPFSKFRTRFR